MMIHNKKASILQFNLYNIKVCQHQEIDTYHVCHDFTMIVRIKVTVEVLMSLGHENRIFERSSK